MNKKVWYACYGSNLMEERFLCYIAGGRPSGAFRVYPGCTDKEPPKRNKPVSIHHDMYFAKSSKTWSGGGAGFLDPVENKEMLTYGRMYLISESQFIDLVKQEIKHEGKLDIDIEAVVHHRTMVIKENCWYGRLLYLGASEGIPIVSFTNKELLSNEINAPNEHYLEKIIMGLKETYNFSPAKIYQYLSVRSGIRDNEIIHTLKKLTGFIQSDSEKC